MVTILTASKRRSAAQADPRPSIICVRSVIGYGSPNQAGTSKAHGEPLGGRRDPVDEAESWLAVRGALHRFPPRFTRPFFGRRSTVGDAVRRHGATVGRLGQAPIRELADEWSTMGGGRAADELGGGDAGLSG
jgi:hypothetical protein